jgi:hypothetical protein
MKPWAYSVAFAPDGSVLAASLSTGDILLYEAGTGRQLRRIPGADSNRLCFAPDGRTLASVGDGFAIRL